ncbi:hypothetical protein PYW07_014552 [Mythimna separata]|uniref:3CxxC-type domain-containing protein n=1 Tax=Mythimna separata TaxID=271217 RepID=A0AAD7YZQ3_MYTSE|nr:hypothetical protein PYW07_014552 [Mythimna separata]
MGCCFSSEDDDSRRHYQYHPTLSSPPLRATIPRNEVYARCVPPQRPTVPLIRKPTPAASSTRSALVPKPLEFKNEVHVRRVPPRLPTVRVPAATSSRSALVPKPPEFKPKPGALYGEYKCGCGYFWASRLSWRDRYQQCKRCKAHVRPRNQRELKPSDFTSRDQFDESLSHPKELCEMCKRLGDYCGKYKYQDID